MTGSHLEVGPQQVPEQGEVAGVDGRVHAVAAQVHPLPGHLDAGGHAPDVVLGLDHDDLLAGARRAERGEESRGAGAHDHDVGRPDGLLRRAKMGCWRLLH